MPTDPQDIATSDRIAAQIAEHNAKFLQEWCGTCGDQLTTDRRCSCNTPDPEVLDTLNRAIESYHADH